LILLSASTCRLVAMNRLISILEKSAGVTGLWPSSGRRCFFRKPSRFSRVFGRRDRVET